MLVVVTGSPFTFLGAMVEDVTTVGTHLVAIGGTDRVIASYTTDATGALTQTASSPITLLGPSFGVSGAGSEVVAGTTSHDFHSFTLDATGEFDEAANSPEEAGARIWHTAFSD